MVRIDELVDHGHFDEFVSGGNQRIGIVDKCSRITGNGNDFFRSFAGRQSGQPCALRCGTGSRRIKDDRVETLEFCCIKRIFKQVFGSNFNIGNHVFVDGTAETLQQTLGRIDSQNPVGRIAGQRI